jgi:hypothetical protein
MLLRDGIFKRKLTCSICGAGLEHQRVGRIRQFCSDRCRDEARRSRDFMNFVGGFRSPPTEVAPTHETREIPPANSVVCKAIERGRGSILSPTDWPIDLLGGSRHSSRSRLDPELRRNIIEIEVGKGRI